MIARRAMIMIIILVYNIQARSGGKEELTMQKNQHEESPKNKGKTGKRNKFLVIPQEYQDRIFIFWRFLPVRHAFAILVAFLRDVSHLENSSRIRMMRRRR